VFGTLVHFYLAWVGTLPSQVNPYNDISLYGSWMQDLMHSASSIVAIPGISKPFVYPFPAVVPMLLAFLVGGGVTWQTTMNAWLVLISMANLIGVAALVNWGKGTPKVFAAAYYWIIFLGLLGPVALGRIDSVATLFAIFGLVALNQNRIRGAMMLFTMGAWMKIWPVSLAISLFVSDIRRKALATTAAWTVVAVIAAGVALGLVLFGGGVDEIFGFVLTQNNRGLQIEAPVATIWLWFAKFGLFESSIYFDQGLLTNQIAGQGAFEVASLLSLAMVAAIAITVLLGVRAYRAGADSNAIFAVMGLTATLDLIVFNKVGSPQFEGWLAVPIMAGILFGLPRWRFATIGGLAIALLTFLVYPVAYMDLMGLGWLSIGLLTARNVGLIALLVWANLRLKQLSDQRPNDVALN
jgi:hypothetical protein